MEEEGDGEEGEGKRERMGGRPLLILIVCYCLTPTTNSHPLFKSLLTDSYLCGGGWVMCVLCMWGYGSQVILKCHSLGAIYLGFSF